MFKSHLLIHLGELYNNYNPVDEKEALYCELVDDDVLIISINDIMSLRNVNVLHLKEKIRESYITDDVYDKIVNDGFGGLDQKELHRVYACIRLLESPWYVWFSAKDLPEIYYKIKDKF